MVVPTLETARLVLRGHTRSDFQSCLAMWSDPAVVQYIGGRPFTAEEVWTRLLRYVGHWHMMGFGFWAVREKATDQFVGEVGFADFMRDMDPALGPEPEMGWVLDRSAHGRGFATEAVRAALVWGTAHLPSRRTVCIMDPANHASRRVAVKCGYRERGRSIYQASPVVVFERDLGVPA